MHVANEKDQGKAAALPPLNSSSERFLGGILLILRLIIEDASFHTLQFAVADLLLGAEAGCQFD